MSTLKTIEMGCDVDDTKNVHVCSFETIEKRVLKEVGKYIRIKESEQNFLREISNEMKTGLYSKVKKLQDDLKKLRANMMCCTENMHPNSIAIILKKYPNTNILRVRIRRVYVKKYRNRFTREKKLGYSKIQTVTSSELHALDLFNCNPTNFSNTRNVNTIEGKIKQASAAFKDSDFRSIIFSKNIIDFVKFIESCASRPPRHRSCKVNEFESIYKTQDIITKQLEKLVIMWGKEEKNKWAHKLMLDGERKDVIVLNKVQTVDVKFNNLYTPEKYFEIAEFKCCDNYTLGEWFGDLNYKNNKSLYKLRNVVLEEMKYHPKEITSLVLSQFKYIIGRKGYPCIHYFEIVMGVEFPQNICDIISEYIRKSSRKRLELERLQRINEQFHKDFNNFYMNVNRSFVEGGYSNYSSNQVVGCRQKMVENAKKFISDLGNYANCIPFDSYFDSSSDSNSDSDSGSNSDFGPDSGPDFTSDFYSDSDYIFSNEEVE